MMILGLLALVGLFVTQADATCQVLGLYTSPTDFTLSVGPTTGYSCVQYHIGPRNYTTTIELDISNVAVNCASNDNIIAYEQSGNQIYNVCDMKRLYGLTYFKITYSGAYFIISLSMGGTATVSGFFHFTLPTAAAATTTTTAAPTTTTTTTKITTTASQSSCGVPHFTPNDSEMRIVGGVLANPNSWPWQVAISDGNYLCGASLIAPQWILTAGHCDFSVDNPFGTTTAYLGMETLWNPEQTRTVIKRFKFGYNSNTLKNDLMLLKLSSPVTYTDKVQPICLPSSQLATTNRVAMVTGWGLTVTNGQVSDNLRQVAIPILGNQECIDQGFSLDSTQMCAGYPSIYASQVKDSCQGDSGGPLFTKEGTHYVLGGIVSYGGQTCDGFGVYTNVYSYVSQIQNTMATN